MSNLVLRSSINALESELSQLPQVEFEVKHYFLPGIYVRELHAKAGTMLVGKLHKKDHIMMLQSGKIKVVSEQLTSVLTAPCTIECKAGAKRAAYIIEDTVWITIHPSNETDLDKLEAELIANDFKELE